jgi:N-acetylglutamate synthase-like GNAT family acetyltransferase
VDLHLRRATSDDAEGVAYVYVESWNQALVPSLPPRVLDSEQTARWRHDLKAASLRWWLAQSGESVIGFVGTGPSRDPADAELGELDTIAVSPSAWRRGVGRRLMDVAVHDLVEAGYRQAVVWTLADYESGRHFYEATGWHTSGESRADGQQIAFRRHPAGLRARRRK